MGNVDHLDDACAGLSHTKRSMFGGYGYFAPNGGMFAAVVDDDRIALKLPEPADHEAFVAEGAEPWVYDGKMTMRGWLVIPDAMYDEPRALAE
jgi:TfoX/Sxy family transcriptional regulator of competence genes